MKHLAPTLNPNRLRVSAALLMACAAASMWMPLQAAPLQSAWSDQYVSRWLRSPMLTVPALSPSVQAAKKSAKERAGTSGKERSDKKPTGKVKFIRGNEESVAQRSARLSRECKGRVNAGMCEGYTR